MKFPKILFFLMLSSILATAYRCYYTFIRQFEALELLPTGEVGLDRMLEDSQQFARDQFLFDQNIVNKILLLLLIALLVLSMWFYFRKDYQWTYGFYLIYTFLNAGYLMYRYQGFRFLFSNIDFPEAQQLFYATAQLKLYINLFLFLLALSIIGYSFLKQNKSAATY